VGLFCPRCHLPYDTLVRDEARLSMHEVVARCEKCLHITVYRSNGVSDLTEREIAEIAEIVAAKRAAALEGEES
jgi:hypothetical protein